MRERVCVCVYIYIYMELENLNVVLRSGEVADRPIECLIPMRCTQLYRFPRHMDEMQFGECMPC